MTMNRSRVGRWAIVGLLVGCTADNVASNDDTSDDPCVPGQSIACECDDGNAGAQVCEPDGVGYDECLCEGADDDDGDPSATGAGDDGDDDSEGGSADDDDGDPTGDPTTDPTIDPSDDGSDSGSGVPDFNNDIVPIFYSACGAGSTLCHARNAYFPAADQGCRGWLSLEDEPLGSSFDDLDPETMMPSEGPVNCPDKGLHDRLLLLAPWECGADARYIVPGSLDESYIWRKLTDATVCGDFRVMPPPEEGFEMTPEQVDVLEAWILAGAPS
jgi:hypothetical protein